MFRGITKTLNKFQKKNDDLANSPLKSSISNFEISSSLTNNENDLLNSQIFNSHTNSSINNIKNSQIENEIPNRNQNFTSAQSNVKQEIPIRNSQISASQNSNYRRPRQNPLNNRYSSSYKRSNTPTSKYNKPFKIPSIVEKKPKVVPSSQFTNSQISNSQSNNVQNINERNNESRFSLSQSGFRSSNIFNNNEFKNQNEDNKIGFNKNDFVSSNSISSSHSSSSNSNNSNKKFKIPGPAGRLPVLTPEERKILFYSHHINDIMKKRNNNYGISTQFKKNAQYNSFKRAKERVDLALNKNEVFESGSWVLMLKTLDLAQTKTKIIDIVKLRFPVEKIKSIVVLIKRIKAGDMDVSLIVQDPTGDMPAIMTKEAYEKYFGIMNQGTTLLLTNVSVFVIYKKGSYLNIGIKNISKIYTLDNVTKAPIIVDVDKINTSSRDIEKDIEIAQNLFKGKNAIDFSDSEDDNVDNDDKDNNNNFGFEGKGKGKEIENTDDNIIQEEQLNRSSTSKAVVNNHPIYEDSENSILTDKRKEEIEKILDTQIKEEQEFIGNKNKNTENISQQNVKIIAETQKNNGDINNLDIRDNDIKPTQKENSNGTSSKIEMVENVVKNNNNNSTQDSLNNESDVDNTNLDEFDDDDNIDDLMNDISFEKSQELYSSFLNVNRKRCKPESKLGTQELYSLNISRITESVQSNKHTTADANVSNINKSQNKKIKLEEKDITKDNIPINDSINNQNNSSKLKTSTIENSNIYSSGSVYSRMFQRTESLEIQSSTSSNINISENNNFSRPTLTKTVNHDNQSGISNKDNNVNNQLNSSAISEIPKSLKDINSDSNNNAVDDIIESSIHSTFTSITNQRIPNISKNIDNVEDDIEEFSLKEKPQEKSFTDENDVDELDLLMDDLENIY